MLLLGAGPMAVTCVEVARRLNDHGIGVTVVDPRWIKPVDEAVIAAAARSTGWSRWSRTTAGPAASATRSRGCCATPTSTPRSRPTGSTQEFLAHASRDEILEAAGLTPQHLARKLTEAVARRTPAAADPAAIACEGTVIDAGAASRVTWAPCSELP